MSLRPTGRRERFISGKTTTEFHLPGRPPPTFSQTGDENKASLFPAAVREEELRVLEKVWPNHISVSESPADITSAVLSLQLPAAIFSSL